jgi:hypothetical protein
MIPDDELDDAARSMHREWPSPDLWPSIAAEMAAIERAERQGAARRRVWTALAAAAVLVLAVGASFLVMRNGASPDVSSAPATRIANPLLTDEALSDVERAEAQYIAAIEALAEKTARTPEDPADPLLVNLRERLLVIDAAIADCRAEIERNRFNTHLRQQLLSIYREKRRTLEQILEQEQHAS